MREDQIDQAERKAVLENDRRILLEQQGSTFFQHGQAQADEINQGRFRATGTPSVIGSTPDLAKAYPAASAAHQTQLPPEEPLGYRIDAMPGDESSAPPVSVEDTGAPAGAATSANVAPSLDADAESDDAGAPLSHGDEDR